MRLILLLESNVCLSSCKTYIHVFYAYRLARSIHASESEGNEEINNDFSFPSGLIRPQQIDYSSRQELASSSTSDVYFEIAILKNEMFNF